MKEKTIFAPINKTITIRTKMKTYIAKTLFGLEEILAKELEQLGAINLEISRRAVNFESDLLNLYKINMASRTALRILYPIINFTANSQEELYKKCKSYDWSNLINTTDTFAIDSVVNSDIFRHSKYAALKIKDAIVDQIRNEKGERPNVDVNNPTFRVNLHIDDTECTISLDSSGDSLHKRGYRLLGERAPLNEVLAAGMILLSDWDGNSNFVDPMCGSGTIVIEAALIALNIAPNLQRENFGFMNWSSFDKDIYKMAKSELISAKTEYNYSIVGNDYNKTAISSALANAKRAGVEDSINFTVEDIKNLQHDFESGTLITNPPYGKRLKTEDIELFYKEIGNSFKNNFNGFDTWILSSNKDALKRIGLRTSRRLTLFNGSLECKYHNYKMYSGSKKEKYKS